MNRHLALVGLLALLTSGTATAARPATSVSQNIKEGTTLSGSITWTATPAPSGGVSGIHFFIDGVDKWADSRSPYQFNGDPNGQLDTTTLSNGAHTFRVTATWSRRATASDSVTVAVSNNAPSSGDTTPPTVSWTKPVDGQTVSGSLGLTNCEAAASDNVGVDHVTFLWDSVPTNTEVESPYNCVVDTPKYADGPHSFQAVAHDAAGNSASASIAVFVSNALPPPPPSGNANVYVSTGGNDSTCVRGDSTKPCASLSKAYSLAQGGDTISVACGTYGGQTIPARSLGTNPVTIRKDGSCQYVVLTSGLGIRSSHLVVDGFQSTNNTTIWLPPAGGSPCAPNQVTVQNFKASGVGGGCDTITFRNGDVGTNQNACSSGPEDGIQLMGFTPTGQFADLTPPKNMLIDGVVVHDTQGFNGCGSHTDGFQAFGCQGCTIRNSVFMRNDTSHIIIYQITGAQSDVQDIRIENNSFGTVKNAGHGVSIGGNACPNDQPNNVIVQNNTFLANPTLDINCTGRKIAATLRNNVFAAGDQFALCGAYPYVADYNVFPSSLAGCGAHKKSCAPSWVDAGHTNGNVDLASTDTCAKDFVPVVTGTFPPTDIHGLSRPQGLAVDAGADEAG
jgi:hypothetical protein